MDKDTRNRIQRATQAARRLLEEELATQFEGTYDVRLDGTVAPEPPPHLADDGDALRVRAKLVAAVAHHRAQGLAPNEAVAALLRECAFTTLNRFVALKMLEARGIVQTCVSQGLDSSGFKNEFLGLAEGLKVQPDAAYRLYLECLFDEIGREVRALFDPRDPASLLWPRRGALDELLSVLNAPELASVWGEDETIGWVYQYFNGDDERRQMRAESQAPRNSRELAVRNQFFTPRYVVEFLTDNTLGQTWVEMRQGRTRLAEQCRYLVRRPNVVFLAEGEAAPGPDETLPAAEQPIYLPFRAPKDPRELKVLDPACGSGHFLLYAFDLLLTIYEEAWDDAGTAAGERLRADYPDVAALRRAVPGLVLRHNLHGVDIDPRAAQIAALALWMRAQRAWNDLGVRRADRPPVTRTNIVVAEPMPGEADLLEEFCQGLDTTVARFVRLVFEEMKLAGEAGTLLRIEDALHRALEDYFGRGAQAGKRWPEVESKVYGALRAYAERAPAGLGYRRRLFAEDAARGFAFIELCRRTYDVLLMNPPFGDATPAVTRMLDEQYPGTRLDLFAAFVERALMLSDGGFGAITPRDGFFKKTLRTWRELVAGKGLDLVADLGAGVLDATVRVAAYTVRPRVPGHRRALFLDLVDAGNWSELLLERTRSLERSYFVEMESFATLPLGRFLYWLPRRLWDIYDMAPPLENLACTPRYGLTTLDDERFCRLSFEIPSAEIGRKRKWVFMSKGGDDPPYGGVSNSVVRWESDGQEMAEVNRASNGQIAQTRRASRYYFRPALTFSNRSVHFSVRWHPANYLFSVRGPAVVPLSAKIDYLMGFFNSRLIRALIEMQTASQTYTSGVLKELRWVAPDTDTAEAVASAAREIFEIARERLSTVETDPFFRGLVPPAVVGGGVEGFAEWRRHFAASASALIRPLQDRVDDTIASLYGVTREDIERCEKAEAEQESAPFPPPVAFPSEPYIELASFAVGVAFGRFHPTATFVDISLTSEAPSSGVALAPIEHARDILVDDHGTPRDIVQCMLFAMEDIFPGVAGSDAGAVLEAKLGRDLRSWLQKRFFSYHLGLYSAFGRSAPIYWRLGTASGSYSVWVYLHRFNRDTLHRVLNDHVTPKLRFEENRLGTLASDAGPTPTPSQRRAFAEQEAFVEELRAFRDEVARVAPLWDPDLDDGVIVNAAPLHRLFGHTRSWQKECAAAWRRLVDGEYDWAHLALRLWPERVVPKCRTDRSLAIAHGLEDALWFEDAQGRRQPRAVSDAEIARLVDERRSSAVVDALAKLDTAPPPTPARRARPRVERAPRPPRARAAAAVTLQLELPMAPPPAADPRALDALRATLHLFPDGAGRGELLPAAGIDEAAWKPAIDALVASGEVEKSGQARGTRYQLRRKGDA